MIAAAFRTTSMRALADVRGDVPSRAGARERLAPHHVARQTELETELADLVLEQLAERLDERELHALGQATDVVVALDRVRRALERDALDDVGIESSLREELRVLDRL